MDRGDRGERTIRAAWAIVSVAFGLPSSTLAEMTIGQMKSLGGASQLQSTAGRLLDQCGLPTSISHQAAAGDARRSVSWGGVTMRLPAGDWRISYGSSARDSRWKGGWLNAEPAHGGCLSGVAWLAFNAKGQAGALVVRQKTDGTGYVTSYSVPDNLFEAHRVVGVRVGVSRRIPIATLAGRYGPPDEVLQLPGGKERLRYWILTRHDNRPESLHAVDFEIEHRDRSCSAYEISTSGTDFVREKLDSLLRDWEKDYILD